MGTYYTPCTAGTSFKQFVAGELAIHSLEGIVRFSVIGSVAYIAFRARGIEVWKLSRSEGDIGYKPMGEEMHPFYFDCPKHLMEYAGPPRSEGAREWRECCEEKRRKRNTVNRLKEGDTIRLAAPLTFGGGRIKETDFIAVDLPSGRGVRRVWRCVGSGLLVRITNLESRSFVVVK